MKIRHLIDRARILASELSDTVRKAAQTQPSAASSIQAICLEERVMMSASPMVDVVDVPTSVDLADSSGSEDSSPSIAAEQSSVSQNAANLVFVDESVSGHEQLIAELQSDPSGDMQIIVLHSDRDGIAQISAALAGRSGIESIHIVSHGSDGRIQLGSTLLTGDSLSAYAGQITAWSSSLSADADLLIYGCDLAANEEGRLLVDAMASLTGADVAASDNLTGHADLGGDWILEYAFGDVSTDVAFGFATQASWYSTLDITSGLVLHNNFDANANDSSGNNYNGTLTNGALINTTSVTNNIGPGKLFLDGTNDYVDFSSHVAGFQGLTQGTISAWVYANSDRDVIFELSDSGDANSRLALFRDADGSFDVFIREGSTTLLDVATTANAIAANTWTHVAVTVDASGNKLYVNGVQQGGLTYAVGSATTNVFFDDVADLDFAAWGVDKYNTSSFTRYFNGMLDDGRVYDRALSASDITELSDYTGLAPTSTISVTNTLDNINGNTLSLAQLIADDGGDGISLREAIAAANNRSGLDTINFSISGTGVHTINVGSSLTISDAVTVNATTDNSFAANGNRPAIILDGNDSFTGDGFVLTASADGTTIRGFLITDFNGDGIEIQANSNNNTIAGNYIGRLTTSGVAGAAGDGNTAAGVRVLGANNTIGGTTAADRNVISGNTLYGVSLETGTATGNTISGNYIGLEALGTVLLGNGNDGVFIIDGASNNTVGGATTAHRNVIAGNSDGVQIGGAAGGSNNNVVRNNYIGTDGTGTIDFGNLDDGIDIDNNALNNQVLDNLISGNTSDGIDLGDAGASTGTIIQGNLIGTQANGTSALGNSGHGILVGNGGTANNTRIGGTTTGQGNTIAYNALDGVAILGGSTSVAVIGNSIYGNSGQGIDLVNDGITYNDVNDTDAGVNGLLNFPILKTAVSSGGNTTITGAVRGLASTTFRVEFFSNPYGSQETTGYGEARTHLGATTVTTDAAGKATFSALLTGVTLQTGATVTATATIDLGGGSFGATSEFAGNILANQPNLLISGTYTGTGADNRTIAGLGFRPELVMVFSEAADIAAIRSSDMVGDVTKSLTGATALAADRIQSLTADGFTLGTNAQVNTNGTVYHWVAFGAGADIDFGAFTGNGTSQSVTGVGFTPEYVMTMSATAQAPLFRSSLHANSFDFNNSGGVATGITSLNADGFSVGSSGGANQSGSAMYYVAFNQNASYFALNSYSGDSTDNRNITGIGFEPELVFVKRVDAADQVAFKSESTGYNVDKSVFGYGSAQSPNYVQNLQSNGFQVGTNARVNQAAATYNYFAFRQTDAPLVVDTTSDTSDGTVTSINNLRANKGADGFISLREALAAANATHNGTIIDTIQFNIAGLGVHTINLTAAFPDITDAIFLDGWSEPDYVSTPVIELNGSAAGGGDGLKLTSTTANSTVRGFIINRFGDDAIQVGGSNTTIVGNYIGTNAAGTAALANLDDGINIDPASLNNIIGGTTAAERNVISGNLGEGIHVSAGSTGNLILGNYIGLNAAGTTALANSLHGINLLGGSTTIGGTAAGARNVISGNTLQGIFLDNSDNNTIQGNYVGTNAAGTGDVNGTGSSGSQSGIVITNGSSGNVVGGTAAGARNVLSGNNWFGLEFLNAGTDNNTVQGNYIGTDYTGLIALGNTQGGVSIYRTSNSNVIGGNVAAARNIISGNLGNGIYMGSDGAGPVNNKIQGNYIGLDATGNAALGNAGIGIYVTVGTGTIIGTDADSTNDAAERNVISSNSNGIVIEGAGSTGSIIAGNYVGTDATGLIDLGNTFDGVRLLNGATGNTIGGTTTTHRNIIAGNNGDGIEINGEASDGNFIRNNWIGLAADGIGVLGNSNSGILVSGGADNTTIGGIGMGNVIVGSGHSGISIDGASSGTVVYGNFIGVNAAGTVVGGNNERGILLANGATNNTIGGTTAGQGNTITASGLGGVYTAGIEVAPSALTGNTIAGNSIYGNVGLGIDLGASGVTANDNLDPDTGPNILQNFPVITAATTNGTTLVVSGTVNTLASVTGLILHFYATPNTGDVNRRDGRRYLGTTTVNTNGSGNGTFTNLNLTSAVAAGEIVTVTATSPGANGNTSEFSQGFVATATSGNSAPNGAQAVSTNGGGLNLNTDGGNDAILTTSSGAAIFGGRTQFSAEVQFSSTQAPVIGEEPTLFSYATNTNSNEFRVTVSRPDASTYILTVYLNGSNVSATGFDPSILFNGANHQIGFAWSTGAGDYSIYVDGTAVGSGTGFRTGTTIGTGGVFIFGNDQDVPGGGYDPTQSFHGTLRDTRVFSDVRTAAEMAASWNGTLAHNEAGILANWRFDDLSAAGETTDSVSGNNFTVGHIIQGGFTASTSTLTFQLNENSSNGTVVGGVYGTDVDRESRISQLLAADPDLRYSHETGKFYKVSTGAANFGTAQSSAEGTLLNGVAGQLGTIHSGAENAYIKSIVQTSGASSVWLGGADTATEGTWRWYNGLTAGNQFWQGTSTGYAIDGAYENFDTPDPNGAVAAEDGLDFIAASGLWRDEDVAGAKRYLVEWNADDVLDATHALTFSITSQTVAGAFMINSDSGALTVANGSLLNYESNPSHTVTVRVTDGSGATYDKAFTITLNNVAIEPTNSVPGAQNTNEETNLVFSAGNGNAITVTDSNGSTNTPLQVSLSVANGTLTLSGTTGLTFVSGANGTGAMVINGTESDINAALNGLNFAPNNNYNGLVNLQIATSNAANLEGLYTFDGGNANDQSLGAANNGTFFGNATTISDPTRGTVLSLDGSGDYAQISGVFGQPANVTLSAWVNLNQRNVGGAEVISLGDTLALRLDQPGSDGVLGMFYNGTTWVTIDTQRFLAGTGWHHVAFTFDDVNNVQRVYIDGELAATANHTESIAYLGGDTFIGRHGSGTNPNWDFNGKIDDARVFTRALSATEIASMAAGNFSDSDSVAITVNAVNDQAAFTSLNGTPAFTEGGSAVVFDSNVTIFDAELSAANNFSGATLTLVRNGGANAQDVYSATGTLSALTQGGSLVVGGTTIGTVTTNSSGTLVWTFNASATNALVNSAMQQIAYSNSSDTPPATAQINWTFNDNNSGAQGTGGALTATGSTTVSITATNDAPTLTTLSSPVATVNEDAQATITFADLQSAGNEADVDGTVTAFVVKTVSSGTLLIGTSPGTATAWAAGTNDTIDATRQGYWTGVLDANGTLNAFTVVAKDDGGLESATPVQVQLSVTAVNDAPIRTAGTVGNLTVLEDSGFTSLGFSGLSYGPGGGVDESGQTITFDVTAVPTGLGNVYLADGTTLVTTSSVLTLAELQGLQFRTTTNVSGTSAFQFNPTDSGGTANGGVDNFSEFMLITVTQVNDAPTLTASALNPNFTEAAGLGTQAAAVNVFGSAAVSTIESSQRVTGLTFTISGLLDGANEVIVVDGRTITLGANSSGTTVTNGLTYNSTVSGGTATIVLSGGSLTTASTQTIVNGITYQDTSTDNPTGGNRVFTLTQIRDNGGVADGGSDTTTLSIASTVTVTAVNDEQVLTTFSGLTVNENSTGNTIDNTRLLTTDVDNTASQLIYTVTTATSNGTLRRSGTALGVSSTFTQADINSGLITYDHNGSETATDSFSFSVDDGIGSISSGTFNFTVTPVNDNTPVITSNGGGLTASINVVENTTSVTTVTATDWDLPAATLTYSIDGGADSSLFAIDSNTGALTFVSGRNREVHTDTDLNGVYEVTVRVFDGTFFDTQAISVTITDFDEFDVVAPVDADAAANTVNENAANGTTVGITASASDADATNNTVTFSLTDNAGGRFAIDANTGVVTVADGTLLNREAAASHNITVRATSTDGSTADTAFTINVNDIDEFDVSNPVDGNAAANAVNENAANGTTVGVTASASDADATNNTVTFSLTDNAGGRFAIDTNTGVVTVADGTLLNREAAASHNIMVRATSSDGSTADTAFTINVNDVDEFDVGAVSDSNAAANTVAEDATIGTTVGVTAFASDADATTNTITYTLDDNAGGRFAVDTSTGVVTVAGALDYETNTSHNVTVRATSADGSFATQVFTITVTNVNDGGVGSVNDTNAAANAVAENSAIGTTVGVTAIATDPDTTDTVTYSLDDNAGGRFAIDNSTGVVTVASGIDREAAGSWNITIRATSSDASFSTLTLAINISDVDEFDVTTPVDANVAANAINENAANGTTVGVTASASDADATNNTVTFSLTDNAGGRFAIDANTGVVTVADGTLLNREAAASHNITVRATSTDGSTADTAFTINVNDIDEFDVSNPVDGNAAANAVNENAANGTTVGVTASASDADATNNTVTFSLTDNAGGRFAIDTNTGVVTVADGTLLNREAAASHNITIRATSTDGSTADTAFTINVNDIDEFDVTTPVDANAAANAVNENAGNGTTVGVTASASDADATNNTVTYSLTNSAGGRFAIDTNTGVVTVADGTLLNREAAASHNIMVRATSSDGSTADTAFTINVNDVDEFDVGAVSDSNAAANTVAEDATIGTTVGVTAFASDADATTNTITYTLDDNAGGRFAVDTSTGVVTVAGALDYETNTSHNVTVRATSADSSFATQVFTIAVTNVNDGGVGPVSDTNAAANAVAENSAIGTTVGVTAIATDPDTTDTVTYSLDDNAGGRFAIDNSTGVVTVASGIDREAAGSWNITIRATSSDASFSTLTLAINISDVDEFDVTTPVDANVAANAINENAANGTTVGITASASDADATNNTVTFSLTDNAGGRFAIDANTGVVTVADGTLLNREAAASHNITIRATSSDGSTADTAFTINVNDVDEFDVTAPADANAAANAVNENAANGTTVGVTASASDADATNNTVTFSLTDNAGGRFAIDANTGLVTVADGTLLNREAAASHNITVRATSSDGSTADTAFTINLNDLDEFDVGSVTDANAAANSVAENSAIGTTVGLTGLASDADATNNTVTFSLTDNAGGRFAIDANTGVVTVADGTLLNREAAASHNITVRATSADGSTADTSFTINVNDIDEFDVSNPVDGNAAANAVNENAANGTTVGVTASASDADATNNTVTFSLTDNAGGRFAIDANTAVVTVADGTLLNREAAASHNITVRATSSDGSTADTAFTINVNDVDEFDVGAVSDSNAAANTVAEDATIGTTVGVTAFASDADATTNTITYTLDDNAGGRFAVDTSTGVVTVAGALDYETNTSHNVTVRATSADGSFATQVFTINVTNVNEASVGPVSDTNAAADTVAENSVIGTTVGVTASATDPDTTDTVTYSLDDNAGGRFAIDNSTGVVTVASGIDREAAGSWNITIRATSSDASFSTLTLAINISDVDEFDVTTPVDANVAANAINENAANGTTVGVTASASDADATNNTVTFSLTDNAGGRFAIDANTGVVTVADGTLLNREAAASHNITIRATSTDGSTADTAFTINVNDIDEFDVSNPVDGNAAANAVNENAANGTTVGVTASASDADATNNTVTYSLTNSAGGRFAIDTNTGVVTVADGTLLDREAAASHNITIRATSSDGSTADTAFTINVNDVDEFDVTAPVDANAAANAVNENAANGTTVGITASASDADATNNTVTFSLTDNAGGRFAIDANTGVVTVADGTLLNREAAASHNITVRATSADGSTADTSFTINVNDIDEFDVSNPVDGNAAANAVNENAANGTTVGVTASASDADATNNTVTYSLTDSAGGRFAIDANTGVVTVADGTLLNREAAASHNITIRATSSDGSTADTAFTINVNDVDEFDVGAESDSNAAANTVAEDATIGTTVGVTAFASDADATTNTITYTLDDNAGGRFAVDTSTGVVTVAGALDYETNTSHNVTVRATSADGSFATQVFTINVTNVNEASVGPVSDVNAAANAVAENSAIGTTVGVTASATDPDTTDTVTYSLDDNAGGRFAIDNSTGVVTVASGIDREAAGSWNITIRATSSDASFSTLTLAINISDVDEFDVTTPVDANVAANAINENAANGTTVGITAAASDADATNNTVTYSLTNSAGGRFAIDTNTGVVTVADGTLLNREAAASHNITVRATSSDGSTADTAFTINVNDVDEFDVTAPVDANAAANAVNENAANGTTVGITASASDADATNNTVTFSLTDNAGGRFAIDANTGVVTVADGTLLNREAAASHNITVRATSADGSTADTSFTINVNDIDEFDVSNPVDGNAAANAVNENAANGTTVGVTASASDADATNNTVTYSLTDSAGGRFAIDANTGVVTVADGTLLNREAAASHNITIRATSSDGSTADTAFTINVNDVDEFDVGAVSDSNAAANTVAEDATIGTTVGVTAFASDADATTNTITYTLDDNAGGRFAVDTSTGVVTVAGALDYETNTSHNVTVRATSADGSFATQVFTINVTNVNEASVGPVSDVNAAANAVAENSAIGTTVGVTASATDPDTTDTVTYSLDDNAGGRFAIDNSTGVVTVASGIDREAAGSWNITIRATSSDASFSTLTLAINISDVDEFDVTTPVDANVAANAINENAANGTTVGVTASASDADATNNTVTFSLTDNAGGRFAIDANTGVVTVADGTLLNREAAASHNITVRATSTDGSTADTVFTINVNDIDEFDVTTPVDANAAANAVNENAANGTTVGVTASASDADATNNTVTYSLFDSAGGRFAIDANTGVVTVANGSLLDFEVTASHNITVQATSSDGSTASQNFTIAINDLNEFAVSVPTDSDAATNDVNENVVVGTTVGVTANASDLDATTNTITYSLTSNPDGLFQIDVNTGVVTTAAAIDRETHGATRNITVQATSSDGSTASQNFTININDVNEFAVTTPVDTIVAADAVDENAVNGTVIGITAFASDADATNNMVTYSLSDNAGGRFAINANTGVVTVADGTLLDRETAVSNNITVRATSSDGSSADMTFTININDVNEFAVTALVDVNGGNNEVDENAASGLTVGITTFASDADATNNTINYSLVDNDGGRFVIDSASGTIRTAGVQDFEIDGPLRSITVRATSSDGSVSDRAFDITINDINESPTVSLANQTVALAENTNISSGIKIADIVIGDDALGTNILSLSGADAGSFEIVSGELRLRAGTTLDFELKTQYSVTVSVDDPALGSAPDHSVNYILSISNLDDAAPVIQIGQMLVVDENSPVNTILGSVIASDTDTATALLGWTIVAGNDDNLFAINTADGTIIIANNTNLDFEQQSTHVLTLTVSDGIQISSPETIVIRVNNINDAPDAATETFVTGQFAGILAMQPGVLANDFDEDGDALSALLVSGPAYGTLILNPDGSFQYSPIGNFFGTDSFVYLASDGLLASGSTTVEVFVTPLGTPTGSSGSGGGGIPTNPPGVVVITVTVGNAIDSSLDPESGLHPDGGSSSQRSVKFNSPIDSAGEVVAPPKADEVLPEADMSTESRNPFDYLRRKLQGLNSPAANRLFNPLDSFEALVSMPLNWLQSGQGADDQGDAFSYQEFVVGPTAITTTSLTVGYALWLIRGGSLVASFVSSLPAWTSFDPLPILKEFEEDQDTESLVNIIEQSNENG